MKMRNGFPHWDGYIALHLRGFWRHGRALDTRGQLQRVEREFVFDHTWPTKMAGMSPWEDVRALVKATPLKLEIVKPLTFTTSVAVEGYTNDLDPRDKTVSEIWGLIVLCDGCGVEVINSWRCYGSPGRPPQGALRPDHPTLVEHARICPRTLLPK